MDSNDYMQNLFEKYPDGPVYLGLDEAEQRELAAVFILDNPEVAHDLLDEIPEEQLANLLSQAALTGECNARHLSELVNKAVFPNPMLTMMLQVELDVRFRTWTRFRQYEDDDE